MDNASFLPNDLLFSLFRFPQFFGQLLQAFLLFRP